MQTSKKIHPPLWWGKIVSLLPKFDLPWIEPASWTPELAEKWIRSIPAKCPFERVVWWRGRLVLYIPPLCPLNPFSVQLYRLRIEAQEYLANLKKT